jgi:capsular polysaccharide biosynthesis protein
MIAANLERRQIGEQFKILDPASRPEKPFNHMQRFGVMASAAGAGLVLGLLLVGLREVRDSSFKQDEEVHRALQVPVLALIPVITSAREQRAGRRRTLAMDIGGSVILVAAIAVVVLWRLQL